MKEVIVRTERDRIAQLLDGNIDELKLDAINPGVQVTKLGDVEYGMTCDIAGIVRSVSDLRTFTRKDGEEGQVRNVRIQDSTADIRCALWGDHADTVLELGQPILIRNVDIQDGWKDDIEASVGWSSSIDELEEPDIDFVTIQIRGQEPDEEEADADD